MDSLVFHSTKIPIADSDSNCSKQHGRTFHVITAANSTGEAVVQYFSGQTDVQPDSCGSFVRVENDNSRLAGACGQWGYYGNTGKWGVGRNEDRLYIRAAVIQHYQWLLRPHYSRLRCDEDKSSVSAGDFWKVYVR